MKISYAMGTGTALKFQAKSIGKTLGDDAEQLEKKRREIIVSEREGFWTEEQVAAKKRRLEEEVNVKIQPIPKITRKNYRLQYGERVKIETMLRQGRSVADIAETLGYTRSGIYTELKRGGTPYSAETAQKNVKW